MRPAGESRKLRRRRWSPISIATLQDHLPGSALELIVACGVMVTAITVALDYYLTASTRAQLAEIASLTSVVRSDLVVFHAEYGRWPLSDQEMGNGEFLDEEILGRYTRSLELGPDGAITAVLRSDEIVADIAGKTLTYRPALMADDGGSVVWVCGNARPPATMTASGANKTTIAEEYLQFTCRGGNDVGENQMD